MTQGLSLRTSYCNKFLNETYCRLQQIKVRIPTNMKSMGEFHFMCGESKRNFIDTCPYPKISVQCSQHKRWYQSNKEDIVRIIIICTARYMAQSETYVWENRIFCGLFLDCTYWKAGMQVLACNHSISRRNGNRNISKFY